MGTKAVDSLAEAHVAESEEGKAVLHNLSVTQIAGQCNHLRYIAVKGGGHEVRG